MTNSERQPSSRKPVLAEIPADFDKFTDEQQDRFVADLASQLLRTWPVGRRPYRPEDDIGGGDDDRGL